MLTKFRAAGLIWPTLVALPALLVLMALGAWQMSRKVWKEALIGRIEEGMRASPVDIGPSLRWGSGSPPQGVEYSRLKVAGRFLHSLERHYYALGAQGPGWHIVTPMVLDDGMVVLINRGYVPDALKSANLRSAGQKPGRIELVGLLRLPERKAMFTPVNDPARNMWFWRDVAAMLRCDTAPSAAKSDCDALANVGKGGGSNALIGAYPFIIDAEAEPANPGGWPKGGATNLQITNRHLEYALTWYGLAAALIGFYVVFARGRLRSGGSSSRDQ